MSPAPILTERPQVRAPTSGQVRSGPTSGRQRRRARARAPRVTDLGEILRSARQSLDQDPLSQRPSPPSYDFSQLRIHDDAEEGDLRRTEVLDPATLGIRMATDALRSLRADPEDKSRRVRLQLARIDDPDLSSAVLAKLHVWLPSSEYARVTGLVAEANASASPLPLQSSMYPAPVEEPDPLGDQVARDDEAVSDATNRAQLKAERLPWDAQTHAEKSAAETAAAAGQQRQDVLAAALRTRQPPTATPQSVQPPGQSPGQSPGQQRAQAQPGHPERGAAMRPQAAVTPAVGPAAPVARTGAAPTGAVPAAPMTMSPGGAPPVDLNRVDALANAPDGPLARHQMRDMPGNRVERQPDQAPPGEEPIGAENTDLPGIDAPEPALPVLPAQQPIPAAAYLPAQDIDVSGVPTADQLKLPESGSLPAPPAAPSFPSPPPPAMVAPPPGTQDPEEARLAAQAAREGATIEPAPGQIGPDDAETEPDVAPEPVAPGPELTPAEAAAGPAGPESVADDTAAGPGAAPDPATPAGADPAGPAAGAGPATPATSPGALPQDASLEPGGGSCAGGAGPSADAGPAGSGPAGGGAPGGGGSAAPPPQPPVPDVSQQQPQTALATVGRLPVVQFARGLSGVNASVGHSVGQQRDALAKSPPELERPSGAPRTLHGPPPAAPPASYGTDKVQKATAKQAGQQAKPQGKQVAGGPTPADQVPAPKVTGNAKGNATAADVQHVQQAVSDMPTTDPALDHASVGVAPKVQLTGQADPALTDNQLGNMRDRAARILTTGRDDATRPLGENEIYPDVPAHEILKPSVAKGSVAKGNPAGPAAAGVAVNSGPAGDQAVSAIAQQEHGPQIRSAVAQGESRMTASQQAKQKQEAQDRQQHHAKIAAAIKKSTDDETAERGKVAVQARQQRKAWQDQEDKLTSDADTEAGKKHDKARADIEKKKSDTDTAVEKRQQNDNAQIIAKRKEAEAKARSEQAKKQNQSGGWFGSVCSVISDAFHALVSVVKGIFDAARKFVQDVINTFKKVVTGLIDVARKWIIANISAFATLLLAIGNVLLAAFPALRDKFRKLITGLRNAAIALVNKVANFLKKAITDLLNVLVAGLFALLDYLQTQLLAAIKLVQSKIQAVINLVKNAIALFGEFAQIVKDVAADPGGWIRKLGSAIVNGIHYYLWDAIKTAVKNWFVGEIQQILGLGQVLQGGMQFLEVLKKGCITIGKIVQMAWQAMIKALPQMLIQLVIQKLVAFLVPALGGIIQIVQGVIAAYNTISSIITAIGRFVAFLKDVKAGTAARPFAQAVAAGAVALINFVANWLLSKLKGAAQGIGTKLKGIAMKILAFLKRGAQSVRKGVGKLFNAAKRGAKAAAGAIKRGIQAAGRLAKRGLAKVRSLAKRGLHAAMKGIRALGHRLAKTKFGKFLKNIYDKLKSKYQSFKSRLAEWRAKFKKWREDRKKNQPTPEERLEAAVERIRKILQGMLKHGVPDPILRLSLRAMRLWYRLTDLTIQGLLGFEIDALLNPREIVLNGNNIPSEPILNYIRTCELDVLAQTKAAMKKEDEEDRKNGRPERNKLDFAEDPNNNNRKTFKIPAGMNLARVRVLMDKLPGDEPVIQEFEGDVGGSVHRSKVPVPGTPRSSWFLRKVRDGKILTESTTYEAILARLVALGPDQIRRAAGAFAQWSRNRTKVKGGRRAMKFRLALEDVNFLSALETGLEARRSPGNMLYTVMRNQLMGEVAQGKNRGQARPEFEQVYRLSAMFFEGSSSAGNRLRPYLGTPNSLEDRIAELEGKQDSLSPKESKDLGELKEALELGQRQVQLLEEWFKRIHAIATTESREQVLNRFCDEVESLFMKEFPPWQPSNRVIGRRPRL